MISSALLHHNHNSGFIGGTLHHLLEHSGLSEPVREFIMHLVMDSLQIFVLLLLVMTAVFFLQSFINFNKLKAKLSTMHNIWAYGLAVVLGMLSPFCSCSIVPVLLGLVSVGVPLSVCLCMLTSASLLNLTAITSVYTMLGATYFMGYVVCSALIIGISTFIFSRLVFEAPAVEYQGLGEEDLHHHHHHAGCDCEECNHEDPECGGCSRTLSFFPRFWLSFRNALGILKTSWFYILLGVALSAAIASFFSMETIVSFVSERKILSVTAVVLTGLPIHSDLFSILPVLLLLKEISPAISLAFMLAVMVISIPGVILLTRVLKSRVIAAYAGLLVALTLMIGYVLVLL